MKVGTRSLLIGVHNVLWHPWTVARAWRHIYGRWPTWEEWVCIFVHDWGYLGCENMDGVDSGRNHPERGAAIAQKLVYVLRRVRGDTRHDALKAGFQSFYLTIHHSSHYARAHGALPSALYLPDKASILFEPRWWYLFRAKLSGEIYEYIENSPLAKLPPELRTPEAWLNWYRRKVKEKLCGHSLKA